MVKFMIVCEFSLSFLKTKILRRNINIEYKRIRIYSVNNNDDEKYDRYHLL